MAGTLVLTASKWGEYATIATGAKSFSTLKGSLNKAGLITRLPTSISTRVWPSAGDLATRSAPKLPLEPGRFSITTGWPQLSVIF